MLEFMWAETRVALDALVEGGGLFPFAGKIESGGRRDTTKTGRDFLAAIHLERSWSAAVSIFR